MQLRCPFGHGQQVQNQSTVVPSPVLETGRVVITGAPGSGKTTTVNALSARGETLRHEAA